MKQRSLLVLHDDASASVSPDMFQLRPFTTEVTLYWPPPMCCKFQRYESAPASLLATTLLLLITPSTASAEAAFRNL